MKAIIQIPCLNEAATLPATLADLPRSLPGIDEIEFQVIDDGSTDATAEVARDWGVEHIIQLGTNRGLAFAFAAGVENALQQGADILVNTDGDNQYAGGDIGLLTERILANEADIVVGCRPIREHPEFGVVKKALQLLGSWTLRTISRTKVRDAASGFRAYSRAALLRLHLYTRFSHCMETLIQAGNSSLRVASVDIRVNRKTRESRLFRSLPEYVVRQSTTMVSMFLLYRPFSFFAFLSSIFIGASGVLALRYLILTRLYGSLGTEHTPSLIVMTLGILLGAVLLLSGFLGELQRAQRCLSEELLRHARERAYTSQREPPKVTSQPAGNPPAPREFEAFDGR